MKIWTRALIIPFLSSKVEEMYKAKHVGLRKLGSRIVDVYYQPNPDTSKGHSSLFGLYASGVDIFICNADTATPYVSGMLYKKTGEFLLSTHVHDFHYDMTQNVAIDGGQEYMRLVGDFANCAPAEYNLATSELSVEGGVWQKIEVRK